MQLRMNCKCFLKRICVFLHAKPFQARPSENGYAHISGCVRLRRAKRACAARQNALSYLRPVPGLRLSKKSACGGLFRQNTFPLRLRRGRGNVQGNLAAQGFRIHRTCQRGRPPAGSGQPVPRERGMPSPNRRFGEGTGDSECSSEGTEGSVSPVGCCHRRWQSDPKESTETSGGRGQRPPRRLRLRVCGPPNLPEGFLTVCDAALV